MLKSFEDSQCWRLLEVSGEIQDGKGDGHDGKSDGHGHSKT